MFKKSFLDKMKQELIIQKQQLQTKLLQEEEIDIQGDDVDHIQGNILANVSKRLSERDSAKLVQIDKALQKMEDNSYGICEECQEEIFEKRLIFNPCFSICVACAEQQEFEAKNMRVQ